MKEPTRVSRRTLWIGAAIVSWPLLLAVLYLTSTAPAAGTRWADANPGRGSLLAATGILWMTAMLLAIIWKLMFSVLIPLVTKGRR